ncbi:hypothetical protein E3N88_29512 [Mikania micrantha]|uniref:Retrotransposon gag domain-containing protein n=1 Tax=Mikania micrantha TaxID=192012 RepID=A0A5N6MJY4_9ASTR|nr:hypothetical protein E3N88_29512 [Mikania micrantha]
MAARNRTNLEKTVDNHAITLLKVNAFMQKSEQTIAPLNANVRAILTNIDETPKNFKVQYVSIHLEGNVVKWHPSFFKMKVVPITDISWKVYSEAIVAQFSTTLFKDVMGMLTSLSQSGSLEEFCLLFDASLLKISIRESNVVSIFLKAMKPEIGGPAKTFKPKSLREALILQRFKMPLTSSWDQLP